MFKYSDIFLDYYAFIYSDWIGPDITNFEIDLIESLLNNGGKILDVGAGSGRHFKSLGGSKYILNALENDIRCIQYLINKSIADEIISQDVNSFAIKNQSNYDLVTLFFNTFCEVALTYQSGLDLIKNLFINLVDQNGYVLMCITDTDDQLPVIGDSFNFQKRNDSFIFDVDYKLTEIDEPEKIVTTEDSVRIIDLKTEAVLSEIYRINRKKWWKSSEIMSIANENKPSIVFMKSFIF